MREIKFRAWDKEAKKMFYDFILASTSPKWGAFPIEQPDDKLRVNLQEYDLRRGDELHGDYTLIDWSNYYGLLNYEVMQFTGLHDKNGKEIYEGDIVKGYRESPTEVYWHEFTARWRRTGYVSINKGDAALMLEVIGNIYENPELLEARHDLSR